jgi:hypothetical protein
VLRESSLVDRILKKGLGDSGSGENQRSARHLMSGHSFGGLRYLRPRTCAPRSLTQGLPSGVRSHGPFTSLIRGTRTLSALPSPKPTGPRLLTLPAATVVNPPTVGVLIVVGGRTWDSYGDCRGSGDFPVRLKREGPRHFCRAEVEVSRQQKTLPKNLLSIGLAQYPHCAGPEEPLGRGLRRSWRILRGKGRSSASHRPRNESAPNQSHNEPAFDCIASTFCGVIHRRLLPFRYPLTWFLLWRSLFVVLSW